MTNSDSLLELLEFPLADPAWVEFLQEHEHELEVITSTMNRYVFPKFGMELYTLEMFPITMHFDPQMSNNMPLGLKAGFGSGEVHQVLGPHHDLNLAKRFEKYQIGPYCVTLLYSLSDDDTLEEIRIHRGRLRGV